MPGLFQPCRENSAFRPLSTLPFVHLDLRYASPNNICGRDLYQGEREAWLHQEAYDALLRCGQALQLLQPSWRLRVYDAARPSQVQAELFARVAGTGRQAYVADPAVGSAHNYGFAVDLGLSDGQGRELDLGSPFDSFLPISQPQLEEAFASGGQISAQAMQHRQLLRTVMACGGFRQHALEWWHFDLRSLAELKRGYSPL